MPERKEGVVPRLRFPEFRDAGPWEVKSIKELSDKVTQGGTPNTSINEYWDGDIPWITPAEMGNDAEYHYIANTNRTISMLGLKNSSAELLPKNSVIISSRAPIGYVAINKLEMATNQGCKGIIPKVDVYYDFLYFCLLNAQRHLNDLGAGAGFKELSTSVLKKFQIPVPKLPEQQKIADCLSSLDRVIELEAQKLEALKAHKKGLMQLLFPRKGETTPRLRFPTFRDAEEWEVKRLGEICSAFSGGTPISSRKEYYGGSIPFIRSAEINQDTTELFLTEEGLKNSSAKLVVKGDILVALYGANSGDGALSKIDGAINQAILCLRSKFNHLFILDYWRLRKNEIVMRFIQGGQGNLSAEIVKSIAFAFPSLPEQQKIADFFSSLDEIIDLQAQKLEAFKTHKKGLMQQLFPQEVGIE